MIEKYWQELLAEMEHEEFNANRRYYRHNFSYELVEDINLFEIEVENDLAERIEEAMSALTVKQRNVIYLIYFVGYKQKEIAVMMECTPGAVSLLHKKALDELKKILE